MDNVSVFHLSFNRLTQNGKPFGVSVFARNVASSSNWVWEIDADARYVYAGPQCRAILGYMPEEIIGSTPFDLMPPAEAERVRQLFNAAAAERRPIRGLENTNLHKDGHAVILERNGVPVIEEGRLRGYRGMDRDITTRKQGEEALRESEGRLHLALESGRMYAFEWNRITDVMKRSSECALVMGVPEYPTEEKGTEFLNRLPPEDRSRYIDALSHLAPAQNTYRTEFRKMLPDGRLHWVEARGRGFFDSDGKLARVVGIASDVTPRKEAEEALRMLSSLLIDAQEQERKRVARELHDGVSQALAVISIQMSQAAQAASEPELSSRLEKLYEKLQCVLADIGHLSHELHPSTLKHLGLSAAIRVLCEDITNAHGVDVVFADTDAPEPESKDTALCLYRVAQEALQNIVKHGHCKQAWVELRRNQNEISLHIRDQGLGFDTTSAKTGLGLISIRERLRLVGGRVVITSKRGSGTRVDAYAPLGWQESQRAV